MRTRSLLFSKLEKLLDQQIGDVDQMNTATSQSIDTGKIEELSTYIDRVEQQIKKIRTEAATALPN